MSNSFSKLRKKMMSLEVKIAEATQEEDELKVMLLNEELKKLRRHLPSHDPMFLPKIFPKKNP